MSLSAQSALFPACGTCCAPVCGVPSAGRVPSCRPFREGRSAHCKDRRKDFRCSVAAKPAATPGKGLDDFEDFVLTWQERLCSTFAAADGSGQRFCSDGWARGEGAQGYGITRVLEGGSVLEKAACNVSVVHGTLDPQRAAAMSSRGRPGVDPAGGQPYSAVALSLVFHSASPLLPTFRADVRCFEVAGAGRWFGGGADLTPFYLFDEDAREFHRHWKGVCDPHGAALYPAYKKWCDDYFAIPARAERRGVGGIFFDDLSEGGGGGAAAVAPSDAGRFTRDVGEALAASYLPIIDRRRALPFSAAQRTWQLQRRGRYLEFNLLYDRGVRFGLTGGRFESVMVSAPPLIRWDYNVAPAEGTEEARLVAELRREPARDWAAAES